MIRAYSSRKSKIQYLKISEFLYLSFIKLSSLQTTDLVMVQKTITGILHKEGKSQRVIAERTGYSQSAVSKHIKCKVDWKEVISEEKLHKLTANLRILSSKADSITSRELHKE